MKPFNCFFVIFGVIFSASFGNGLPNAQLRLVTVMFRHGERTPEPEQMKTFPKYENKDNLFLPYGVGQLTTVGKETMYYLGKKIRDRYSECLYNSDTLDISQVKMESTKYFRSLLSAQFVLGGLLDWNKDDMLKKTHEEWLKDQYVNETLNAKKEMLLKYYYDQPKTCPVYLQMLDKRVKEKMANGKLRGCMPFFQLMMQHLGVTQPDPLKVWEMYEVYKAQQNADGVSLPDWFKLEYFEQMKQCIEEFLGIAFETKLQKKLSGGIYTEMVMRSIKNVLRNKTTDAFLELYSGHDTTLAPALAALGGLEGFTKDGKDFSLDIPTYGSAVIVELYKDTKIKKHFVKIQYWNGKDQEDPVELKIKGCEDRCYLTQYRKVIEPVRISAKKLLKCPSS